MYGKYVSLGLWDHLILISPNPICNNLQSAGE